MKNELPPTPQNITEELFENCISSNDFMPILFEWYKYAAIVCNYIASIDIKSPVIKKIKPIYYGILIGLLNRCSRLMLANIALTHKGNFGETSSIIDRCILESAIKLRWLCSQNEDCFKRFIADGLKSDLEFKKQIELNIESNNGQILAIEKRMLDSIKKYITESGLTEDDINKSKKLPDLASMLECVDMERLLYVIIQKIGSHHVHGTWSSLYLHYLERNENGIYSLRDHDCSPSINQYIWIPLLVLEALKDFIVFTVETEDNHTGFIMWLNGIQKEILNINEYVVDKDFEPINMREDLIK